jgi:hypothetical protein
VRVINSPAALERSVFLAGSIEMGKAEDWQSHVELALSDLDVVVFNPRRAAWDSSWKQSIDNPHFREQVEWEMDALDRADVVAMWLDPKTLSPITLLEFGLHARGGRLVVGCPEGFWRRGNLEVVCARYNIKLVSDFESFIEMVRGRLS